MMRLVGAGAGPAFDPVADAQAQWQTILAYFAAGQAATTTQYQAAQLATAALGGDLDAIQTGVLTSPAPPGAVTPPSAPPAAPTSPSATKTWVSAGAAAGIATATAVVGGTVGYLVGKGKKR